MDIKKFLPSSWDEWKMFLEGLAIGFIAGVVFVVWKIL